MSGLFALVCALSLPLAPRRRRVPVTRLLFLAVVMAAGVLVTWEAFVEGITVLHSSRVISNRSFTSATLGHGYWQVPVIVISSSIMVLLVAAGEALLHLVGAKPTPTPPPVRAFLSPDQYRSAPPGHRQRITTGLSLVERDDQTRIPRR